MNLEERFKSWGNAAPSRGTAKPAGGSPDDVLFAATEVAPPMAASNPYGDDNEFDDGFGAEGSGGSMGPCMFEGPGIPEKPPADLVRFYEDVRPPTLDDDGDELAELLQLDTGEARPSGLQIGPPPIPMGAAPVVNKGRAGPPRGDAGNPPLATARIPGRDRVSYSQPNTRRPVQGVANRSELGSSSKPRTPTVGWLLACTWTGAGIAVGSYTGIVLGSPVLGSVSFTLGVIAAMFSVVLLRR